MKLLRIKAKRLPLFKETLDIFFYAKQRIMEDDKENLYNLFSNIYINPTEAIIGINASGKTSALKVILLALNLINNEPINHIDTKEVLGNSKNVELSVYFYSSENEICKLKTKISAYEENEERTYKITEEYLWKKNVKSIKTKADIFDFKDISPFITRNENEEFLSEDVSIMISYNKKIKGNFYFISMLSFTNMNILPVSEEIPLSVIKFLDPTIEKLYFEKNTKKNIIHLKFKNEDEIILNNAKELENYLSSGTIKGIIAFTMAINVLKKGGYMVVDEIENHFNKEIVSTLVRFFMDIKLNKNGAVLIFTTHYPEILDEFDRNDSIYITKNKDGICIENLSDILTRNDIKKSEAYKSGFLEGTTPAYDAYLELKKSILASM